MKKEFKVRNMRLCPRKIYKLRQTKLSQCVYFSLDLREREETKTKYSAPNSLVKPKNIKQFDGKYSIDYIPDTLMQ